MIHPISSEKLKQAGTKEQSSLVVGKSINARGLTLDLFFSYIAYDRELV
jgi:hypothetical protein